MWTRPTEACIYLAAATAGGFSSVRICEGGEILSFFRMGQSLQYLAVVSNREEALGPAALVRWHWEKAGTIEFVHDVSKNDLAAGTPPSGKFGANAAWYRLTLLTYNVLTVLRRLALPERFRHARPKRLRYEVFTVPAEIHTHARQVRARLGVPPLTVDELVAARGRLRDLRTAIRSIDSTLLP